MITSILRVFWRATIGGPVAENTFWCIREAVQHLKRGGSINGAAGLASRDPKAADLFLQAMREAGL